MRRVLRPGGRAVIVDWHRPKSFARAITSPMLLVYLLHHFGPSRSPLDAPGIETLMSELGFEEIARYSFGAGGGVGAVVARLASETGAVAQAEPQDITRSLRCLTGGGFEWDAASSSRMTSFSPLPGRFSSKRASLRPHGKSPVERASLKRSSTSAPTKAHLFFVAMVPPALNVKDLLFAPANDLSVVEQLERIALSMMSYFREVAPILLQLVTNPEFHSEKFVERRPHSPFGCCTGLIQYLESERERGRIVAENVGHAALTLFAALHSLAFLERR